METTTKGARTTPASDTKARTADPVATDTTTEAAGTADTVAADTTTPTTAATTSSAAGDKTAVFTFKDLDYDTTSLDLLEFDLRIAIVDLALIAEDTMEKTTFAFEAKSSRQTGIRQVWVVATAVFPDAASAEQAQAKADEIAVMAASGMKATPTPTTAVKSTPTTAVKSTPTTAVKSTPTSSTVSSSTSTGAPSTAESADVVSNPKAELEATKATVTKLKNELAGLQDKLAAAQAAAPDTGDAGKGGDASSTPKESAKALQKLQKEIKQKEAALSTATQKQASLASSADAATTSGPDGTGGGSDSSKTTLVIVIIVVVLLILVALIAGVVVKAHTDTQNNKMLMVQQGQVYAEPGGGHNMNPMMAAQINADRGAQVPGYVNPMYEAHSSA